MSYLKKTAQEKIISCDARACFTWNSLRNSFFLSWYYFFLIISTCYNLSEI